MDPHLARLNVVELRQYLLRHDRRDELIDLFDRELVEPQEATGMTVIGQFRDPDRPDYFVWLRGFPDMAARRASLTAFYDGPVWAANRQAANATMIDSDDVLVLRPTSPSHRLPALDTNTIPITPKATNTAPADLDNRFHMFHHLSLPAPAPDAHMLSVGTPGVPSAALLPATSGARSRTRLATAHQTPAIGT